MPLRFGTWIGGDQDGNPAAGPATIGEALDRARQLTLTRYRGEVRELASSLGLARGLVGVSDELVDSLARDERGLAAYAAAAQHLTPDLGGTASTQQAGDAIVAAIRRAK